MSDLPFYLALITVLGLSATALELALGGRKLGRLRDVPPLPVADTTGVTIVIAARNEERNLEQALRSVLGEEGAGVEVVVVDDRSTDATGEILDRLAAEIPRLRVVHVTELPDGWLGKNHALQVGAREAGGEYLLFTDADVVLEPAVVRRALAFMRGNRIDHLTVAPDVAMPGYALPMFFVVFGILFTSFVKPWKVRDPSSSKHVGIGAFNMIRADVYRAIGTHRAIAMRPDDDMKLGKLVKKHGFRQEFLGGTGLISVEWYTSVRELVHGLRKNSFAGVDYRLSMIVMATVSLVVFFILPFVAVFFTEGATRLMNAAAIAITLVIFAWGAREQRTPAWYGIGFPLAALLFIYILWNSTLYTLIHRGIEWRGTHYPLEQLRANRV